jgi:hypothetical protein
VDEAADNGIPQKKKCKKDRNIYSALANVYYNGSSGVFPRIKPPQTKIFMEKSRTETYSRDVLEGTIRTCTCLESRHRVHPVRNSDSVNVAQVEFLHSGPHRHVSRHNSTRLPETVRSRPLYIGKIFGNADETGQRAEP